MHLVEQSKSTPFERDSTHSAPPMLLRFLEHTLLLHFQIRLAAANRSRCPIVRVQKIIQVAPPTLACYIRVVRRGDKADGSCRTAIQIAGIVGSLLDLVRRESGLVVDDCVVRHFDGALETSVSLEIKVKVETNAMVNA